MKFLFFFVFTVSLSNVRGQNFLEERKVLSALMKDEQIINFINKGNSFLCKNVQLKNSFDKKDSINFRISDTLLPLPFVLPIFQSLNKSKDTCILKFRLNRSQTFNEDSMLKIMNFHDYTSNSLQIFLVNKIGTIQPFIIAKGKETLIFDKIKFGELTYIFFDTINPSLVRVFATTVQYN